MTYEYEHNDHLRREVEERKRRHLANVYRSQYGYQLCMHDNCGECCGTGIKHDGSGCVHMISCPCPKCSPRMM